MHRANPSPTEDKQDSRAAIDRAYRLILGRAADEPGAEQYLSALRSGAMTLTDICASLASSEEFAARLEPTASRGKKRRENGGHADPHWIDVAELIETVTVEELSERAEGYFRAVEDPGVLLTKPFKDIAETPDLLVTFGQVLRALRPLPGMTVLDFGAGTCWTSRFLTQLGCKVIALDVSPTALELGKQLYEKVPVLGDQPSPEFLVFDGYRIDLPDAAVDRILSYDAFHHVPNPGHVIGEMARVLRPGGIAAFAEPGPRHSHQPQSQYEMRNFGVIENDVIIEDIWATAHRSGFAELRLCLLDSSPRWVDLDTFDDVVEGRDDEATFAAPTRAAIADRRMFWLRKEGAEMSDSREADGLVGELSMTDVRVSTSDETSVVEGTCRVRNPGPRHWLPSDAEFGPVLLGVRVHLRDQTVRDLTRIALPGEGISPGEEAEFPVRVEVPAQGEGAVAVEFDLVSEWVTWFGVNGSPVVRVPLG
ncbi:methyltransferase domain-containing protein [Saccharomonospora sp. NPDC006951]